MKKKLVFKILSWFVVNIGFIFKYYNLIDAKMKYRYSYYFVFCYRQK